MSLLLCLHACVMESSCAAVLNMVVPAAVDINICHALYRSQIVAGLLIELLAYTLMIVLVANANSGKEDVIHAH